LGYSDICGKRGRLTHILIAVQLPRREFRDYLSLANWGLLFGSPNLRELVSRAFRQVQRCENVVFCG